MPIFSEAPSVDRVSIQFFSLLSENRQEFWPKQTIIGTAKKSRTFRYFDTSDRGETVIVRLHLNGCSDYCHLKMLTLALPMSTTSKNNTTRQLHHSTIKPQDSKRQDNKRQDNKAQHNYEASKAWHIISAPFTMRTVGLDIKSAGIVRSAPCLTALTL